MNHVCVTGKQLNLWTTFTKAHSADRTLDGISRCSKIKATINISV